MAARRCPLVPQLYRQKATCSGAKEPFHSKVDLMEASIRAFEPLNDTCTRVLLDTWYSAKRIWKAARERGFVITTGLRSNRAIQVVDPENTDSWCWVDLATYAAGLMTADYQEVIWPHQQGAGRTVWVHSVRWCAEKE